MNCFVLNLSGTVKGDVVLWIDDGEGFIDRSEAFDTADIFDIVFPIFATWSIFVCIWSGVVVVTVNSSLTASLLLVKKILNSVTTHLLR
jgi:hypothetical protein